MEILHYTPEDLPNAVYWQVLSFLRTWDTEGFVGQWRGRRWISRPEFHPVHFVLMDDDFVVGHAEVVSGQQQHRGTIYGAYGISAVFVYPDYRGAGHGTALIHAATHYITRQSNADIGLLWCAPPLGKFYAHAGWQPMETTKTLLENEEEAPEKLFMRFFSPKGITDEPNFHNSALHVGWTTW